MVKRRKQARLNEDNLIAVASIKTALARVDAARAALNEAADDLVSTVNQPDVPASVRAEYLRFWRAGGCSAAQWIPFLNRQIPIERAKVKGGLRLISSLMVRRPL